MNSRPLVSLCIPTNGVTEWVFPVLESIYEQGIDNSLFEVVITDNGKNEEFKKTINDYCSTHSNIKYAETEALPFVNEIESYKRANGELIKFVNHRTKLILGTLQKFLSFVEDNRNDHPIIYFSNGVLEFSKDQHTYNTFDQFVKDLSYWSSWSTGMTIWKDDFDKLPEDVSGFNELFPHTDVLFRERNRGKYILDNSVIFDEIPQGKKPKGDYDLFYAFGVEYPWIICNLLRDRDITPDTFRYVKEENLGFIAQLYFNYFIKKEYCSYDLGGYKNMFGIYYTERELKRKVSSLITKKIVKKVLRK